MRSIFRTFLRFQVFLYRLTEGKFGGKMMGFKVLLLSTIGRKSGKTHTTPLGYFQIKEGFIIVASNGGRDNNPAWFINLQANPKVKYQILKDVYSGNAEVLSGELRKSAWQQVVASAPQYARYEKSTKREIPLLLLNEDK
jgi:deazaflavin-dependent oxidoreductase (nitroreductase family)